MTPTKPIAILLPTLACGGTERVVINLIKGLIALNVPVELVLARAEGDFLSDVPAGVKVVDLKTDFSFNIRDQANLKLVFSLVNYFRESKPDVVLANLYTFNVLGAIAQKLSGISTNLILVEHNPIFNRSYKPGRLITTLMIWFYPKVKVVAVSNGLAQALETNLKLKPGSVKVIYNPVIDQRLRQQATASLEHPWFQPHQPPVFLAVGRLHLQKNYPLLIQAFALVRQQRPAHLIILGDGEEIQKQLETLIEQLGIGADVSLAGYAANPYAYMSRADVVVLSSRWEGLPTVLIEAMACGCQLVSTDCPYGPEEILAGGKYGRLVPVDDVAALANAMQQAIDQPINPDQLMQRAENFSLEQAVKEYMKVMKVEVSQTRESVK
jgi:glycosyltransferase involved in cell wall biosynthesis